MGNKQDDKRAAKRELVDDRVEFYVDADIIDASSVDVSETGIRIMTGSPITIRFRRYKGENFDERQARLVWAEEQDDGAMAYGFQYVPDQE